MGLPRVGRAASLARSGGSARATPRVRRYRRRDKPVPRSTLPPSKLGDVNYMVKINTQSHNKGRKYAAEDGHESFFAH